MESSGSAFGIFIALILVIIAVVNFFFAMTITRLMKKINPQYRIPSENAAWLLCIPVFGTLYALILLPEVSRSIQLEQESKGIANENEYGRTNAILYPILTLTVIVPYLGIFLFLAGRVLFILYWIKAKRYTAEL